MPSHMRSKSDLGRLIPGIARYTDASGATVYSSHFYQPTKGHARGASAYSLANSDFEDGFDNPHSVGSTTIVNPESEGPEDEHSEYYDYRKHGHDDCHPPWST